MDLLTANDNPGEYPNSYYAASTDLLPKQPFAQGDLECDVCVVGAGYMGVSAALHLARRGYNVILLDAQRIGFGASGRNGGQVSRGQRVDQDVLEDLVGREQARALWTIGNEAVDLVRTLAESDEVRAEFHEGVVHADHRRRFVPESRDYVRKLNDEYGYEAVRFLDRDEMRQTVNSSAYHGGTLDMGSGHIDPLELVLGLARMALAAGVRIFEQSRVVGLVPGAKALVRTDEATVTARFVVLGCNGYIGGLQKEVAERVMPLNNYIVATEPLGPERQEQLVRNNYAVADSKFVINYFRFSDDHRLLFGGTESYGYRFPRDIAGAVRKPMLEIFPQLRSVRIDYAWGGTLGITMNRLPHYERLAGNMFSFSGFSGQGVALATLSGQIAAEMIAGQAERFDVMAHVPTSRFPGGVALRSPLLALAMVWYSLRDRI